MESFTYNSLPARIVFGSGTLGEVAVEMRRLGCNRALLLSTPNQRDRLQALANQLGVLAGGLFCEATMHTPTDVTERAVQMLRAVEADCVIAMGGGSTTGLGKAIAVRTDVAQIVIPTTYAGSEVTPLLGETEAGAKRTQRTLRVLPETVIYDVDLTLSLPVPLSVTSGINAIAHGVEALYGRDSNPITSQVAEQGISALSEALLVIVQKPSDLEARSKALFGAFACATCLGMAGIALHHRLCHMLGGTFDLPHSETHAVILPYAMAYNAPAAPKAMARVASALRTEDAVSGMWELARSLGAPRSLRELGMPESSIEKVTELAMADVYWNPRPLEREAIHDLLTRAYYGQLPATVL